MKPLAVVGILLIALGILALAVPSITFFTQERVADVGFLKIDVTKPHTIVLNPVAGVISLAAGALLLMAGRKTPAV